LVGTPWLFRKYPLTYMEVVEDYVKDVELEEYMVSYLKNLN